MNLLIKLAEAWLILVGVTLVLGLAGTLLLVMWALSPWVALGVVITIASLIITLPSVGGR